MAEWIKAKEEDNPDFEKGDYIREEYELFLVVKPGPSHFLATAYFDYYDKRNLTFDVSWALDTQVYSHLLTIKKKGPQVVD